ncbi:MAG: protein translocase subunit SecD [Candidatus Omnitrophica bacterium]|nr:protein translocase subunit SecD [Candidatus Omnitrophota bacterium]
MNKSLRNRILIILGVIAAAVYFAFPLQKRINLGLDLKGGMHLVLKVDTEKLAENVRHDAVLRAIEILRNRIDNMGVGETVIQRQGENEILVQLPGITDRDAALAMVGKVAQLEFRLVDSDPQRLKSALEGNVPAGFILKNVKEKEREPVLLEDKVALSGERISDARVDFDSSGFGQPHIAINLNSEGASEFATLTRNNVGHRLAIILDGEVLSAPNIKEAILTGDGIISGQFTLEEASLLALSLRSGALPAPMHVEEERTIGPLLGKDSIEAGINATQIGAALVFLFMVLYYMKAGFIADVALLINLLLIVGSMGLLKVLLPESQVTLTLPGIAGIVLTLGMAVDANVLINERIREELNNGRPIQAAINSGFSRALRAIVDSNVTTLIAAFMLFQFGSGPIKGFAVTLTIGLVASLFTALFVSRTLFMLFQNLGLMKTLPMFSLWSKANINFLTKPKQYICFTLSILMIVIGMAALAKKKDSAYGIDFAGGQIQEYRFARPIHADRLREALRKAGVDAVIQQFDQSPGTVMIRTSGDTYEQVSGEFRAMFPDNKFEVLRIENVGPVVGKALRKAAVLAVVFALGGILVYVGFRFKHFDFATAGVIAILHDVTVALGALVLLNRQIDLLVITALLTIAGYSINDTIVIYDRVRENLAKGGRKSLKEIINSSINETLSRTILTTLATMLVVVALYFYGGEVLNTFALCLLIGFVVGTYSTIFIVSPLVIAWQGSKK